MTDPTWKAPPTDPLAAVRGIIDSDERGVLATVVDVDGRAYRRPGAKMVVTEDGTTVGHVTAGCLTDELSSLAAAVLADGEPRVETYDLSPAADDDVWGLGVGCDGVVDVLIEPIDASFRTVLDAVDAGEARGVLTVVAGQPDAVGVRAYYDPTLEEFAHADRFPVALGEDLQEATARLADSGRAGTVEVGDVTVFVDGIVPPPNLVVVGTGNDVVPITELGARAGFRVIVVGFRGADAAHDRFPAAEAVRTTTPARFEDTIDVDDDTYVVVATHNLIDDRLAVETLLGSDVPYIGLMGHRDRFQEMRAAWEAEGRSFSASALDRLYTPVGLDLGGDSPYEIAISIVGEIIAVRTGRVPRHLANREGPIHDRVDLPSRGT